jgi:t-SNARE complex subunit (syntaxin)
MSEMNQSDHDALIRLQASLEAHSQRESEVSRATLAEVSKMSAKLDQMREAYLEHNRDIRDLKARQGDADLRIATLEQQVDTLQDDSEQAERVNKALASESDKRAKRYAWIAVVASPIVGIVVPVVFRWLIALLAGA